MNKKFQVFVSSTFEDLKDERQAVVEAILSSGNMPAGMELFKSANESQWETIKKWILASDFYILLLGARYGSVEPKSGKSYTQLEYEFAVDNNIPLNAIVLKDDILMDLEEDERHNTKYIEFRELVLSKTCAFASNIDELKYETISQITNCIRDYKLKGWVSADILNDYTEMKRKYNLVAKKYNELANKHNLILSELKRRIANVKPSPRVKTFDEIQRDNLFLQMKLVTRKGNLK